MGKGTVILYSWGDEVIRSVDYKDTKRRITIIKEWELYYGKRFKECYIVIVPLEGCLNINKDGTNSVNGFHYEYESLKEKPKIRPL